MADIGSTLSKYTSASELSNLLESDKFGIISVKSYGAVGDGVTDDTDAIQGAFDAAVLISGAVFFPNGTYLCTTEISFNGNINIYTESGVTLDFSTATGITNACLYGYGDGLTALSALAENITLHDTTIVFASEPDVHEGDILVIYDSADSSFNAARTYYRAGEMVRVRSVSGTTVTIDNPTYAAYSSGSTVSVYKMNTITTKINGLNIISAAGYDGLKIAYGKNVILDSATANGSDYSNIQLKQCYNSSVYNCKSLDYSTAIGYNYGLGIVNCQKLIISNCEFYNTRHGLTVGGDTSVGCVPNRDLIISNNIIGGYSTSKVCGTDLHGNAEHVLFSNNILNNGIVVAGNNIQVNNNKIRTASDGLGVVSVELLGSDIDVTSNTIEVTANVSTSYGNIYIELISTTTINGTINIKNNKINSKLNYGNPIYVYNVSSTAIANVNIINNVLSTAASHESGNSYVLVESITAKALGNVSIKGNELSKISIYCKYCNSDYYNISSNNIYDASDRGILILGNPTPVATTEFINIKDNVIIIPQHCGIQVAGISALFSIINIENNTSINCAQLGNTGSSATNSSLSLSKALNAIVKNNIFGDNQGSPTQTILYYIAPTVTNINIKDNVDIGAVATTDTDYTTTVLKTNSEIFGTVTWDPGSLNDAVGETKALTINGATVGDAVIVYPPYDMQDVVYCGYVQAANTVEIRIQNESSGVIDFASGSWKVKVIKA